MGFQATCKAEGIVELLADVQPGENLRNAARNRNIHFAESELISRDDFVQGVGRRNASTGTAFRLEKGTTSDVVTADRGACTAKYLYCSISISTSSRSIGRSLFAEGIGKDQKITKPDGPIPIQIIPRFIPRIALT